MPADKVVEPPSVFYFAVYQTNSDRGNSEETAGLDILFFYPQTFSQNDRLKHCGLGQALVNFTGSFQCELDRQSSRANDIMTVRSHKHRLLLWQVENGFWFQMNLNLGFLLVPAPAVGQTAASSSSSQSTGSTNSPHLIRGQFSAAARRPQSASRAEFLECSVQDMDAQQILRRSYSLFKLSNGPLARMSRDRRQESLGSWLTDFLDRSRLTSSVPSSGLEGIRNYDINHSIPDFPASLAGLEYLTLDRSTYLTVYSIINRIKLELIDRLESLPRETARAALIDEFTSSSEDDGDGGGEGEDMSSTIVECLLIHNNRTVWSDLEVVQDTRNLQLLMAWNLRHAAPFGNRVESSRPRRIFLTAAGHRQKPRALYVHQHLTTLIGLVVPENGRFMKAVELSMLPIVKPLLFTIHERLQGWWSDGDSAAYSAQLSTANSSDTEHQRKSSKPVAERFLYLNRLNMAIKLFGPPPSSSVQSQHTSENYTWSSDLPSEVSLGLYDLCRHLQGNNDVREVVIRTISDYWLVGRRGGDRELYAVIASKEWNLGDVEELLRQFTQKSLSNILME